MTTESDGRVKRMLLEGMNWEGWSHGWRKDTRDGIQGIPTLYEGVSLYGAFAAWERVHGRTLKAEIISYSYN